jgi:hypothetical protein
MRSFHHIIVAALVLTSITAFADSTSFMQLGANIRIMPNDGSGDNLGGTISGTGVNLTVGGGVPYDFFNNVSGYAPGSGGGGTTKIFFEGAFGQLGGHSFDEFGISLRAVVFNAGGFTFPTNGQDFSVTVPASMDVITGDFLNICPNPTCTFTLATEPGLLTLSFSYYPPTGLYYGNSGSFIANSIAVTPEPGTLSLVSLGIGALAWRKHKQQTRA